MIPPGAGTVNADITANRTFFAETTYTISGYVKVTSGATLTIQPGTRILGDADVAGSSLWILRGARLVAEGTATAPIVFTSEKAAGSRAPGDWGGIIIVGNGIINRTANPVNTEGGAAGEAENYAGGTDNADNSGSLRYVRIEFAGFDISNGGGQELNSLSMYAVGSGTRLEYVQTLAGPGRCIRVVGRRGGLPLPDLHRDRRRPFRLDRGLPGPEPVPDRLPEHPAHSRRRLRHLRLGSARHRGGRLRSESGDRARLRLHPSTQRRPPARTRRSPCRCWPT